MNETRYSARLELSAKSDIPPARLEEEIRAHLDVTGAPLDLSETHGGMHEADPFFLYVERLEQVELLRLPTADLTALLDGSWAGRVFGGSLEVRWQLHHPSGLYSLWRMREGEGGEDVEVLDRKYYLRGTVAKHLETERDAGGQLPDVDERGRTAFRDPALSRELYWPIERRHARPEARAWLEVREYLRPRPERWPAEKQTVLEILNRPNVVAHRLVTVMCGMGEDA